MGLKQYRYGGLPYAEGEGAVEGSIKPHSFDGFCSDKPCRHQPRENLPCPVCRSYHIDHCDRYVVPLPAIVEDAIDAIPEFLGQPERFGEWLFPFNVPRANGLLERYGEDRAATIIAFETRAYFSEQGKTARRVRKLSEKKWVREFPEILAARAFGMVASARRFDSWLHGGSRVVQMWTPDPLQPDTLRENPEIARQEYREWLASPSEPGDSLVIDHLISIGARKNKSERLNRSHVEAARRGDGWISLICPVCENERQTARVNVRNQTFTCFACQIRYWPDGFETPLTRENVRV